MDVLKEQNISRKILFFYSEAKNIRSVDVVVFFKWNSHGSVEIAEK